MDNLINYNGTVLNSSEAVLSPDNRGFSFGDGFFESILVINGSAPLWSYHLERIKKSAHILQLNVEHLFNNEFLPMEFIKIVPKTGIFRVKLSIFRVSPGKYFPDQNDVHFLIQFSSATLPLEHKNEYSLSVGRSYQVTNADSGIWNQIKSLSALRYVIASMESKESGYDDLLILTQSGQISESTNSNVFAIKKSVIITPGLDTGCIDGVFRQYLIQFMKQNGMEIIENDLFWADIENVDEIFLTNAVQWIRPVTKINDHAPGKNILTQEIIQMVRKDLLKM